MDINIIRDFLISVGCKIEYPILVKSFKQHLYNPDPDVQAKIRTQFKDHVNRLATVSVENNMKFIILRPEFRPPEAGSPSVQHQQRHLEYKETRQQQQQQPAIQPNHQQENQQTMQTIRQQTFHQQATFSPPNLSMRGPNLNQQPLPPPPIPQHQMIPGEFNQRTSQPPMNVSHQDSHTNRRPVNMSQPMATLSPRQQSLTSSSSSSSSSTRHPSQEHALHAYQSPPSHSPRVQQYPPTRPFAVLQQQQQQVSPGDSSRGHDSVDTPSSRTDISSTTAMQPPALPLVHRRTQSLQQEQPVSRQQRPESLNLSSASVNDSQQMPPPRPPPRRRQSTASLFNKPSIISKPIEKMSREVHDIARKSLVGRVREHALKFSSSTSSSDLSALMPKRNSSMKENRLSRDSALGSLSSALQRNGSHITNRSRSSHREDESDSSSLQPIDPMRRKWAIEACNCNYNGLLTLLREEPKLASYKDMVNGYTAMHWAAKFGNLDIIKLIAGTHQVSVNIKSSAGHTPLHVAYIFNRLEAANLLTSTYKASPDIRDHSGKRPLQYLKKKTNMKTNENNK